MGDRVVFGAAMRGRYDENGKVRQNLELNGEEICNALTTVGKDTLAVEVNNVIKIGNTSSDLDSQCNAVYSTDGVSFTLTAGCHGYAMGYILETK